MSNNFIVKTISEYLKRAEIFGTPIYIAIRCNNIQIGSDVYTLDETFVLEQPVYEFNRNFIALFESYKKEREILEQTQFLLCLKQKKIVCPKYLKITICNMVETHLVSYLVNYKF